MKAIAAIFCLLIPVLSLAATDTFSFDGSASAYNRLVFPEPYAKVVIPPDARLAEKPIPLNDNRGLLLRPEKDAAPIPVVVQLVSGETFTVTMRVLSKKSTGGVFRYRNAPDQSAQPAREGRASDSFIANLMVAANEGKQPQGMGKVPAGEEIVFRLDKSKSECACKPQIRLVPVAAWRGSKHRLSAWRLDATRLVAVDPRDFWREGVVAVSIEGDVVSPDSHPLLVILEGDNG